MQHVNSSVELHGFDQPSSLECLSCSVGSNDLKHCIFQVIPPCQQETSFLLDQGNGEIRGNKEVIAPAQVTRSVPLLQLSLDLPLRVNEDAGILMNAISNLATCVGCTI